MPVTAELTAALWRLEFEDLDLEIAEGSARFHCRTDRVPRGCIIRTAEHRPNSCIYLRLGIVAAELPKKPYISRAELGLWITAREIVCTKVHHDDLRLKCGCRPRSRIVWQRVL